MKIKNKLITIFFLMFLIVSLSVNDSYSKFLKTVSLTGSIATTPGTLFISSIEESESSKSGELEANLLYNTAFSGKITMNEDEYTVTITLFNKTNDTYYFIETEKNKYTNSDIEYSLIGLKKEDSIKPNEKLVFDIKFTNSNPNNNILDAVINLKFGRKYNIEYEYIDGSENLQNVIYEGEDLDVTLPNTAKRIHITSNGEVLKNYTYSNNKLTIKNVDYDLKISNISYIEYINAPKLTSNMIPVYYENGLWKKADSTNTSNSWYDYNNKKWANAVTYDHTKTETFEGKYFDGASDYLNLGYANNSLGNKLTVVARFKIKNFNESNSMHVISNVESAGFQIYVNTAHKLAFSLYDGSNYTNQRIIMSDTLKQDTWYTVVGTYDGENIKLYLNGELVGTKSATVLTVSQAPIFIGANPNESGGVSTGSENYFNATYSNVIVIKDVLNEETVKENYGLNVDHIENDNTIINKDFTATATIHGATYTSEGLVFDGNDYVDAGFKNTTEFQSKFYIAARFKISKLTGEDQSIVSSGSQGLELYLKGSTNILRFGLYSSVYNSFVYVGSSTTMEVNKWYTVVGVYNNGSFKLYINGVLDNTRSLTVDTVGKLNAPILIGALGDNNGNAVGDYFNGTISDINVVSNIIGEQPIKNNYNTTFTYMNHFSSLFYYNLRSLESRNIGTEIPIKSINSMYTWIPRFKVLNGEYNSSTPYKYDVVFTDVDNDSIDAFNFGNTKLTGFWASKFELSTKEKVTPKDDSELGKDANLLTLTPQIKPNNTSFRGAYISTFYDLIKNMTKTGNIEGFTGSSTIDSHMIKNSEWGAISMLSSSMYGVCGDTCSKVEFNNSNYQTGSNNYMVNTNQSTTGNVYGIYDMNGGASEYVMGNYNSTTNKYFSTLPDTKYYNKYTTEDDYLTNSIRHAFIENKGWNNNSYNLNFVDIDNPWIIRGGSINYTSDNSSIFSYDKASGSSKIDIGTRAVLIVE